MPSLTSKVVRPLAWAIMVRERSRSLDAQIASVQRGSLRPSRFGPPRSLDARFHITAERVAGMVVYRMRPRDVPIRARFMYLHGGGFVKEIMPGQWRFASNVAREMKAEVIVPIYPLAPLATAEGTYEQLVNVYRHELTRGSAPVLFGDSAGGGMALALLFELVRADLPRADRAVLISPWLDLTVADPDVRATARDDVLLSPEMLLAASHLWAGALPVTDYRVSPLLGDLTILRGIRFLVITGTHDILNHDARRFDRMGAAAGLDVTFDEEDEQPHVYVIMPTPEGRAAAQRIHEFLG